MPTISRTHTWSPPSPRLFQETPRLEPRTPLIRTMKKYYPAKPGPASREIEWTPVAPDAAPMTIASNSFSSDGAIPAKHTCDDENSSPGLTIAGTPEGAQSLALLVEDVDAPLGRFIHWVLFNLPPDTTTIPADVPISLTIDALGGARQGINGFQKVGFKGPCPPRKQTHRYFFRVFALDCVIDPGDRPTRDDVWKAMQGHIVGRGELVGTYTRR